MRVPTRRRSGPAQRWSPLTSWARTLPPRTRSCSRRSPEMPELPEVETIRLKLEPRLVGRRFDRVEIEDSRLVRPFEPRAVADELEGERVSAVERRGKYPVVRFESARALLIHLRMTGSLRHAARGALHDDPHRRAAAKP